MSAMDIPEPQVLAESPVLTGGAHSWVHLVLLRRVDQNLGKWLCLKLNGIIEVRDLNAVVIIPLVRNSAFPSAVLPATSKSSHMRSPRTTWYSTTLVLLR